MAKPACGLRLAGKIKFCEMVHEFRGGAKQCGTLRRRPSIGGISPESSGRAVRLTDQANRHPINGDGDVALLEYHRRQHHRPRGGGEYGATALE